MPKNQKDPIIENRESWFRIILFSFFSVVIAYKFIQTPINLSNFQFMDLMNIVLALFAIAMSVAFYFKANETGNQFYDNTYKFTQDMSEILGRIESGFGERLRHLDEGYSGILQRVEKIPLDPAKVEKAIEAETEKIKKAEQEKEKVINDLMARANIVKEEKEKILSTMKIKDGELTETKRELEILKDRLQDAYAQVPYWNKPGVRSMMEQWLTLYAKKHGVSTLRNKLMNDDKDVAIETFVHFKANDFLEAQFLKHELIDKNNFLTDNGLKLAQSIIRKQAHGRESAQ